MQIGTRGGVSLLAPLALSASVLAAAGLYQLWPIKARARALCRARRVSGHPMIDGVHEGVRCLANSAPLMLLLFVGGIMNLAWIVMLTIINILERYLPQPHLLTRPNRGDPESPWPRRRPRRRPGNAGWFP